MGILILAGFFICVACYCLAFALGWKTGKRYGQRLEVNAMIELMEAIQIDCYEQRVFRDRFAKALRWSLTHRTRQEGGD